MMANAQRLRWWIEALRSGKYAHAFNVYRSADDGYCAEGVGMHVSGICPWQTAPTEERKYHAYKEFYAWLGLPDNAKLNFDGGQFSVPWLNDQYKLSHAQMADLIESQWLAEAESYKAYEDEREELIKQLKATASKTATFTEDGQVRYE